VVLRHRCQHFMPSPRALHVGQVGLSDGVRSLRSTISYTRAANTRAVGRFVLLSLPLSAIRQHLHWQAGAAAAYKHYLHIPTLCICFGRCEPKHGCHPVCWVVCTTTKAFVQHFVQHYANIPKKKGSWSMGVRVAGTGVPLSDRQDSCSMCQKASDKLSLSLNLSFNYSVVQSS